MSFEAANELWGPSSSALLSALHSFWERQLFVCLFLIKSILCFHFLLLCNYENIYAKLSFLSFYSTNGTVINKLKVVKKQTYPLQTGDVIYVVYRKNEPENSK